MKNHDRYNGDITAASSQHATNCFRRVWYHAYHLNPPTRPLFYIMDSCDFNDDRLAVKDEETSLDTTLPPEGVEAVPETQTCETY